MTKKVKILVREINGQKKATIIVKETLLHKDRVEIRAYLVKNNIERVEWI